MLVFSFGDIFLKRARLNTGKGFSDFVPIQGCRPRYDTGALRRYRNVAVVTRPRTISAQAPKSFVAGRRMLYAGV